MIGQQRRTVGSCTKTPARHYRCRYKRTIPPLKFMPTLPLLIVCASVIIPNFTTEFRSAKPCWRPSTSRYAPMLRGVTYSCFCAVLSNSLLSLPHYRFPASVMPYYIWLCLSLLAFIVAIARRKLYPKPYPGISYNKESAHRITGDMPEFMRVVKETDEFAPSVFTGTTRKLGAVQLLFLGVRKPLIVLDDPREIEDIIFRRKEFDKSTMAIDAFAPCFRTPPSAAITPELKIQKRLWADVMSNDFLRKIAAPNIYTAALKLIELWRLKASTIYKDQPFNVHKNFQSAVLDAN